jgi:hypothetical protein
VPSPGSPDPRRPGGPGSCDPGRGGQIVVQVYEPRAGQVTFAVTVETRRAAEPPPHIQQDRYRADRQQGGQRRGLEG